MPLKFHDDYQHFSWGEFLDHIKEHPSKGKNGHGVMAQAPQSRQHNYSWTGTNNFEEALELAWTGWLAGQNEALKLSRPIIEKMVQFIERPDIVYDVEGNGYDIGRYCADDPECAIKMENEIVEVPAQPRLIRIVFDSFASAGIDKAIMTAKGAAVAALVELLEFAGNRVEVIILPFCGATEVGWRDVDRKQPDYFNSVTVKAFDQPLEMARLIFAVAHPSTFRRLGFALIEHASPEAQRAYYGFYGYASTLTNELLSEYNLKADLIFAASHLTDPQWQNPESVKKWIFETLKAQGVQIKEEALT